MHLTYLVIETCHYQYSPRYEIALSLFLNCKMETEVEVVEAALKLTASTSLPLISHIAI